MDKVKIEMINKVASQFKAQITPGILRKMRITSGFFNTGLPSAYKQKVIGDDLGQLTRIFDSVKLDRSTTEQFYSAVTQAKDPVQEILVPLLGAISDELFDLNLPELHADIREDFKQYNDVRQKFSDDEFKKIMLKAALIGCSSILTGFHEQKAKSLRSSEPDREQTINKQFMAKVAGPIEAYTNKLTPDRLTLDRELFNQSSSAFLTQSQSSQKKRFWLINVVVHAFLSLVNIFSGKTSASFSSESDGQIELGNIVKDSPIEKKVLALLQAADSVLDILEPACKDSETDDLAQTILQEITLFRANLAGLREEIADCREEHMDFETKVEMGFKGLCESFSEHITVSIKQAQELGAVEQEVLIALVQDFITKVSPSLENTEDPDLTNDDESHSSGHSPKINF